MFKNFKKKLNFKIYNMVTLIKLFKKKFVSNLKKKRNIRILFNYSI